MAIFHQYTQINNLHRIYLIHRRIYLRTCKKLHYIKKLPSAEGFESHMSQEYAQTKHTRRQANGKAEGKSHKGRGKPRERTNVSTQKKLVIYTDKGRCALTTTHSPLKLKLPNQSQNSARKKIY